MDRTPQFDREADRGREVDLLAGSSNTSYDIDNTDLTDVAPTGTANRAEETRDEVLIEGGASSELDQSLRQRTAEGQPGLSDHDPREVNSDGGGGNGGIGSSTDPTDETGASLSRQELNQIREGMRVVDANGDNVGSVDEISFGDPQAITTEGQEMGDAGGRSPLGFFSEPFGGGGGGGAAEEVASPALTHYRSAPRAGRLTSLCWLHRHPSLKTSAHARARDDPRGRGDGHRLLDPADVHRTRRHDVGGVRGVDRAAHAGPRADAAAAGREGAR